MNSVEFQLAHNFTRARGPTHSLNGSGRHLMRIAARRPLGIRAQCGSESGLQRMEEREDWESESLFAVSLGRLKARRRLQGRGRPLDASATRLQFLSWVGSGFRRASFVSVARCHQVRAPLWFPSGPQCNWIPFGACFFICTLCLYIRNDSQTHLSRVAAGGGATGAPPRRREGARRIRGARLMGAGAQINWPTNEAY